MIPSHTITALSLTTLPLQTHADPDLEMPVGAAVLTGRVASGAVTFEIASYMLTRCAPVSGLLDWLDHQFADESVTLAVFRPVALASQLARLPGSECSATLHILMGERHRQIIDLSPSHDYGLTTFEQQCVRSEITSSVATSAERLDAWLQGNLGLIVTEVETDAFAAWRLAMLAIRRHTPLGREVTAALDAHFLSWLQQRDTFSARCHLRDLEQNDR